MLLKGFKQNNGRIIIGYQIKKINLQLSQIIPFSNKIGRKNITDSINITRNVEHAASEGTTQRAPMIHKTKRGTTSKEENTIAKRVTP